MERPMGLISQQRAEIFLFRLGKGTEMQDRA